MTAVGDRRDQRRRDLDAVQLAHVGLDVAGAHATRVQRQDLLVEPRKAPLVLADQRRVEAPLAVAGNIQHHPLAARVHGLRAGAVAVIARRLLRLVAQVHVHLGIEHALGQRLLQLRRQTLEIQRRTRSALRNQLVQQVPVNAVIMSFLRHTSPPPQGASYGSQTQNSLQAPRS